MWETWNQDKKRKSLRFLIFEKKEKSWYCISGNWFSILKSWFLNLKTIIFSGMWTAFFFLGNFTGPTFGGFWVERFGFRSLTLFYCAVNTSALIIDMIELIFSLNSNSEVKYAELNWKTSLNNPRKHLTFNSETLPISLNTNPSIKCSIQIWNINIKICN